MSSLILDTDDIASITVLGADIADAVALGADFTVTGSTTADTINFSTNSGTNSLSGGAGADIITGGTGVDTINGGAGGDTVTGGQGNDIIDLGAADMDDDTYIFVDSNGKDTITSFETKDNDDLLDFSSITVLGANGDVDVAKDAAVQNSADNAIYVFADGSDGTGTEAIADYTDLTDVAAFLEAAIAVQAGTEDYAAVINDLANDKAYVYQVNPDASGVATDIEAGDLTIIGVLSIDDAAFTGAANIAA